jgi:hypothetical protein
MAPVRREVKITLKTVNRNGKDYHVLEVDPVDVALKSSGDEVVWNCKGASFRVSFNKNGTPFDPQLSGNDSQDVHSKECQNRTEPRTYSYTLTVTPTDGSPPITIDPEVIVDDTTPPPPHKKKPKKSKKTQRKKAARKKAGARKTGKKSGKKKKK